MQVQPQPLSYIPCSGTIQPRKSSSSQHWCFPVAYKSFERLEIHFSILRLLIITQETLPVTSVESEQSQLIKRLNQIHRN